MAALSFIEFNNLEELEEFCKKNSYILTKHDLLYAEVRDQNNILWGYVSNNPLNYTCKNPNTKYILVWE